MSNTWIIKEGQQTSVLPDVPWGIKKSNKIPSPTVFMLIWLNIQSEKQNGSGGKNEKGRASLAALPLPFSFLCP
jgi:hypothetical protein